jgi:predicted PurR-regulated permease PerM
VWGIVGMILSVPIMSMLKIVLSKFEETKSLSILMSYNKNIPPENRLRTRIKAIIKRKKIE